MKGTSTCDNSTQNSGEKMAFSINNAGTNGYLPGKKLKFDLTLSHIQKSVLGL